MPQPSTKPRGRPIAPRSPVMLMLDVLEGKAQLDPVPEPKAAVPKPKAAPAKKKRKAAKKVAAKKGSRK